MSQSGSNDQLGMLGTATQGNKNCLPAGQLINDFVSSTYD